MNIPTFEEIKELFDSYTRKDLLLKIEFSDKESIEEGYLDTKRDFLWEDYIYDCHTVFDKTLDPNLDLEKRYKKHEYFSRKIQKTAPIVIYDNVLSRWIEEYYPEYYQKEDEEMYFNHARNWEG